MMERPAPASPDNAHRAKHTWSSLQDDIFAFAASGSGSASIMAVAGSGKTTTCVEMLNRLPESQRHGARFLAFNTTIADELAKRVPHGVAASTFHAMCHDAIRTMMPDIIVDTDNAKVMDHARDRIETASKDLAFSGVSRGDKRRIRYELMRDVRTVIGLSMNTGVSPQVVAGDPDAGIVHPRDAAYIARTAMSRMTADKTRITFDEMLHWTLQDGTFVLPKGGLVVVDEAQDLNPLQQAIIRRMDPERLFCVGDPCQAIYAFRGADAESMQRLSDSIIAAGGTRFPLSTTYRCDRAIVDVAKYIQPSLEARSDADMGSVIWKTPGSYRETLDEAKPGDLIVCRTRAPVVAAIVRLISMGRNACMPMADGEQIASVGRSIVMSMPGSDGGRRPVTIGDFRAAMDRDKARQIRAYTEQGFEHLAEGYADRIQALDAAIAGMEDVTPEHLQARINQVFADPTPDAIVGMTIHRAKGAEANKVILLGPELIPHPMSRGASARQERNLAYVAITRARHELVAQVLPDDQRSARVRSPTGISQWLATLPS